jgi:hypothetical protein
MDQNHALAISRLKEESESRVSEAISTTKLSCVPILSSVITCTSLGFETLHFSDTSEAELDAVQQMLAQFKEQTASQNHDILTGLVTGTGSWQDIPCT